MLEADGSLLTKDELLSHVWPGIFVAEENLKVHISALRKAFGEDRNFIRTEFGRGYRFTATVRSTVAPSACQRPTRRRHRSSQGLVPNGFLGERRTVGVPEITLADALIQLTPRAPYPAGTSETGCGVASLPRRPASPSIWEARLRRSQELELAGLALDARGYVAVNAWRRGR